MSDSRSPSSIEAVSVVLCDLDGVVWLGGEPIEGAAEACAGLRSLGAEMLFVTNNSTATIGEYERRLRTLGIDALGAVISSATAAASVVSEGEQVMVLGGIGLREAVEARGAIVHDPESRSADAIDAVVVGLDREISHGRLSGAIRAVRAGARFIASNTDPTFPTVEGPTPGAGTTVAAVTVGSGCEPVIAGKPHQAMIDVITARVGATAAGAVFDASRTLVIGDRRATDGELAQRLGCRFVHIARDGDTGETDAGDRNSGDGGALVPWLVAPSLLDAMVTVSEMSQG